MAEILYLRNSVLLKFFKCLQQKEFFKMHHKSTLTSNDLLLQTPCLTTEKLKHVTHISFLSKRSEEHLQVTVVFLAHFIFI